MKTIINKVKDFYSEHAFQVWKYGVGATYAVSIALSVWGVRSYLGLLRNVKTIAERMTDSDN